MKVTVVDTVEVIKETEDKAVMGEENSVEVEETIRVNEVVKEVVKEVAKEVVKEVAKEVAKEVVKEVVKEVAKEVVKEVAKEVLMEAEKILKRLVHLNFQF